MAFRIRAFSGILISRGVVYPNQFRIHCAGVFGSSLSRLIILAFQVFKTAHGVSNPGIFRDSYLQRSRLSEPIPHTLRGFWFIIIEANYVASRNYIITIIRYSGGGSYFRFYRKHRKTDRWNCRLHVQSVKSEDAIKILSLNYQFFVGDRYRKPVSDRTRRLPRRIGQGKTH